jgi:ribulose-5-phosphate 4-epimerase/fuculose-1-phosphate aldolase
MANEMSRTVPTAGAELLENLVMANRILSAQNVLDAFGHISARHDRNPNLYLLSRDLAPALVTRDDIVTFDLDSVPVANPTGRYYSERHIHGEIYKARPDVNTIIHCHPASLIPFSVGETPLRPIYHMSAFLGTGVPVFDIREAGSTDVLVRTPEVGRALALSLGDKALVLMRGHGATFVASSVKSGVFRAVYATHNAAMQLDAIRLGAVKYLPQIEAEQFVLNEHKYVDRPWTLWQRQVGAIA